MATDNRPIAAYTSQQIASTLEVFADKQQYWPELRKSFGQDILMLDIIGGIKGAENYIANTTFEVHEENAPYRTMTIGSTVSGGAAAGDAITFNLDAGDVDQYFNYLPRAGQAFWAGSPQKLHKMIIQTVTATGDANGATIVAKCADSTQDSAWHPADYIKTGQTFPLSPAVNKAQGTGATTPTVTSYQKFDYYMEILKDCVAWENAEFAREKLVEYQGKGLWSRDIARMDMNLDAAMELVIWFGNKTTNTITEAALSGNTYSVTGSQGIWDWIRQRGYTLDFTDATDFTIDHFREIAEFGESVGIMSGEWMLSGGSDLLWRIDQNVKAYITNATGSLPDMFVKNAQNGMFDFSLGFNSVQLGTSKINLMKNYIMNNPYFMANVGFKDAAVVLPMGMANAKVNGIATMVPNVSLVYRGLGDFKNRKRSYGQFLGMGGPESFANVPITLEGDISKVHALTDFGVLFLDAYKGVRVINTDYTGQV